MCKTNGEGTPSLIELSSGARQGVAKIGKKLAVVVLTSGLLVFSGCKNMLAEGESTTAQNIAMLQTGYDVMSGDADPSAMQEFMKTAGFDIEFTSISNRGVQESASRRQPKITPAEEVARRVRGVVNNGYSTEADVAGSILEASIASSMLNLNNPADAKKLEELREASQRVLSFSAAVLGEERTYYAPELRESIDTLEDMTQNIVTAKANEGIAVLLPSYSYINAHDEVRRMPGMWGKGLSFTTKISTDGPA